MKIAKLSLVAAVAVAGFTTANAQPLEEAIKNVDVSGSVVYRYNDSKDDKATNQEAKTNNNYKIGLNASSKVNEDLKFNSRFLVANTSGNDGGFAGPLDSSSAGDANVDVELSQANFGYTGVKNTTVTVGKQSLTTPYTTGVMIDENEQNGTGILALSTIDFVTLGAGYFNQTNLGESGDIKSSLLLATGGNAGEVGSRDIAALAAIAKLGPVTADAWYLDMQELFDTYTVGAKSEFDLAGAKLGVDARYASLTLEQDAATRLSSALTNGETKNSIAKLVLTGKAGIVNGKLAYAKTGKDGGITALDSDAVTVLKGWNLNTLAKVDADYVQAVAGVDILANLNLSANYGNLQYISKVASTTDVEEEEVYGQLTYKMSKNLTSYVRYGVNTKEEASVETVDNTSGRLQVAYTF